ncbi:hypothetical protein CKO25_02955 [Thiocapsa imhoffii]|uniref:Uncharacterized protein n=1 Tax=Thiocapsa imhoffii TaxID=382777 RepID=A0A9X0WFI6_9GAMM|nr:hypothetical protein [Thiocapsa imhoffii]
MRRRWLADGDLRSLLGSVCYQNIGIIIRMAGWRLAPAPPSATSYTRILRRSSPKRNAHANARPCTIPDATRPRVRLTCTARERAAGHPGCNLRAQDDIILIVRLRVDSLAWATARTHS